MCTTAQADGVPVLPKGTREAKEKKNFKQMQDMEIEGGGNTEREGSYEEKVHDKENRRDQFEDDVELVWKKFKNCLLGVTGEVLELE